MITAKKYRKRNIEIEFLKALNYSGSGWFDVLMYFSEKYPNEYLQMNLRLKLLIDDLVEKKFIQLPSENEMYPKLKNMTIDYFWRAYPGGVKAMITFSGRVFIMEQLRAEKQEEINNRQKNINRWIAIFTLASVVVSYFTLIKSDLPHQSIHRENQIPQLKDTPLLLPPTKSDSLQKKLNIDSSTHGKDPDSGKQKKA